MASDFAVVNQPVDSVMGVGLFLTGTYSSGAADQSADDWLEQVAAWLEGHEEEPLMLCHRAANDADQPTLFVQMHPCAEEVEISVPAPGVCAIVAKTSTVGPGYHIFVCDLLHALGTQFHLEWDEPDERGRHRRRDRLFLPRRCGRAPPGNAALAQRPCHAWLSRIAAMMRSTSAWCRCRSITVFPGRPAS